MAEEAKRRAEVARYASPILVFRHIFCLLIFLDGFNLIHDYRLRELHTLKGKVESFAKLRGLDIDVNPHYTV